MSTDYNYDEQGQFFPFFILTISGLVSLPLTYSLLKPSKELESTAPRIKTVFKPADEDLIQGQKKKQWRRERRIKRILTAIVGWAVMGYMVYLIIVTQRIIPKIWDPYDILGISRSASEKQIKKQYRKLTLQYHPDKARPNEALNQTIESITAFYVEISKAYKALTDEEVRNNYIQYGHPDGKQSFSIGIALPKFIVTDGHGKYVLLMYGILLGVLLPYVVGRWWYGTQRVTKEKVLVASAGNLFREYEDGLSKSAILKVLTSGEEFKEVLKGDKADSGMKLIEREIMAEGSAANLTAKDEGKLKDLTGIRRKTLGLLWAYLGRVDLHNQTLNDEKYEIAPTALALNESFVTICLAYGLVAPLLAAYQVSQHLIQATSPESSPLLQLPHITPEIASAIEGKDTRRHFTVQQFMDMPEYQRRKLATDQPGTLTPKQYNDAVAVARQIPLLVVERAFFKCQGEKYVVTGSLVQFVVKARVIPPGTVNVRPAKAEDLEDPDPDENDLEAMLGRKASKETGIKKLNKLNDVDIERTVAPPLAFAPYFARDHPPQWHMFLSDTRLNRVVVPPLSFSMFDQPIFDDSGKPTFGVQTLKLQFQAPTDPGDYTFRMHLVCDSYTGMDTKMEVTLTVEDSDKATEIDSEEEISEPDEDSIAGQMNALKQGGLTGAVTTKKKKQVEEVDSDESNTEGSEDDTSETDTETDTDGE